MRTNRYEISFQNNVNVLEVVSMVAQCCEYTKGHRILRFQNVNFTLYGLHFNFFEAHRREIQEERNICIPVADSC